jgi:hypothetical protein
MPIRANLRVLSFGGNLPQYRTLIESKPAFQALKELQMDFNNRDRVAQRFSDSLTLLEVVVPFVRMLKPQLESLRVSSSVPLNFSAFFKQLGPFPTLEILDIHHNFSPNQVGISEILQRTLTLDYLTLQIIPNAWLIRCFVDSHCHLHLQILTIQDPASGLEDIEPFICAEATLEEIYIENRYLQFPEAITIIEALSFCPNLVSLKIKVIQLTVQLLNLLASYLPRLRRLSISCQVPRRSGPYDVSS